jgi:8-oxo-dGTP pyrophosphatase MutT (NUDIX family)
VEVSWRSDPFEAEDAETEAADRALDALRKRGSPSHDGLAGRLSGYEQSDHVLKLELQPARWSLRLNPDNAVGSLAVLCIVRGADGAWLAGRRAEWLASWAGRWALGAGGSVEVDENPTETMTRELQEEWSVSPDRLRVEALVQLPSHAMLLVGQAWLPQGAVVVPDDEHDDFSWWPAEVDEWPAEADAPLRLMATMLAASEAEHA